MMRSPRIAPAAVALIALLGQVAAGPSTSAPADHELSLTIGDEATIDGGAPGGINYTPVVTGGTQPEPTCSKSPEAYCEATLVELSADVPADAPRGRVTATLSMTLDAVQPIADFDLFVYESDADGARGGRLASSGALAGGQIAPTQDGIFWRCPASDECVDLPVTFRTGDEPQYLLVEVHYAIAPVSYRLDLALN